MIRLLPLFTDHRLAVILLYISVSSVARAEHGFACIDEIEVPHYPPSARAARLSGIAKTTVVVGENGTVRGVRITGVPKVLESTIRNIVNTARFSPQCHNGEIEFLFRFQLGPKEAEFDFGHVYLKGPNTFVIESTLPAVNPSK